MTPVWGSTERSYEGKTNFHAHSNTARGYFVCSASGQLDVAESLGKIPLVKELRALEMFLEKRNDRVRAASGPPLTVNNVRFRLTLYVFAV